MASILIQSGASTTVEDSKYRTPVDLVSGPVSQAVGNGDNSGILQFLNLLTSRPCFFLCMEVSDWTVNMGHKILWGGSIVNSLTFCLMELVILCDVIFLCHVIFIH